ncbi:hypothetical protein M2103_000569 [Ereboglobus sp. PH5-5]|uniref:hypothetical protein n=1 Tax=Ereboglobus sp. PH5-5 TaxID=2940529 RepID=UPI002406680B|nr:hypothetical protein [Ereboglobus sp. PH5-5]MDF9832359.1 hypothetical protein [Ereboglobus sp. PH5-5]
MATRSIIPLNRSRHYRHFVLQSLLVPKHFPGFKCKLHRGKLDCVGEIQPTDYSNKYTIRIQYKEWESPQVRILAPYIEPKTEIHMYGNGILCLYHPPTQPWSGAYDLHKTIIPWIAEWLVYYELYLIDGKWIGPAIPHDTI